MHFNVKSIAVFEKQAKRLVKKYASLKNELLKLVQELKENPQQGTSIGKNCFIGANALVTKNLEDEKVVIVESTKPIRLNSSQFLRISNFSNL